MATSPAMTEYRAKAEDALRVSRSTATRRVVSNRGPEHARAVTDVMVANAESSLNFLCGSFSSTVFDAERIEEFLAKPGTRIHVLLDGTPDPNGSSALGGLTGYMTGDDPRLQVRRLAQRSPVHYGIADGRDTRIETDVNSRTATVVFGDRTLAAGVAQQFKSLWDAASKATARDFAPQA